MKIKALLPVFSAVLIMSSCNFVEQDKEAIKIDTYFDLAGLLDQQADLWMARGVKVEKVLTTNAREETVIVDVTDRKQLTDELNLFYEADINKVGLGDAYIIEELPAVFGQRKLVNSARSKKQKVRLLEFNYDQEKLTQIRILVEDKNSVYTFEKEMLIDFETINGEEVLTGYSITGKQDMVLKSDLNFSLKGRLLPNP